MTIFQAALNDKMDRERKGVDSVATSATSMHTCTAIALSDLATKCCMSTKILQTTNRKSSIALPSYRLYRTQSTLPPIMIAVISSNAESTLLESNYSQMPAVALQQFGRLRVLYSLRVSTFPSLSLHPSKTLV